MPWLKHTMRFFKIMKMRSQVLWSPPWWGFYRNHYSLSRTGQRSPCSSPQRPPMMQRPLVACSRCSCCWRPSRSSCTSDCHARTPVSQFRPSCRLRPSCARLEVLVVSFLVSSQQTGHPGLTINYFQLIHFWEFANYQAKQRNTKLQSQPNPKLWANKLPSYESGASIYDFQKLEGFL